MKLDDYSEEQLTQEELLSFYLDCEAEFIRENERYAG